MPRVGGGVAGGLAYSKGVSYSASAALQIQDITELEGFNGSTVSPLNGVPNLAEGVIRTAKTNAVLARTAAMLGVHRAHLRIPLGGEWVSRSEFGFVVAHRHRADRQTGGRDCERTRDYDNRHSQ